MDDEGDWISTEEAAELTGYTTANIRYLCRTGKVRGRKFARSWMVDRASVLEVARQAMEKRKTDKRFGPDA